MNATSLTAIQDLLAKERGAVAARVEESRQRLATLESELTRIDAAKAALDGESPRKKTPREKTRPSQPAAGKTEVIQYMQAVLERDPMVNEKTLKEQVEQLAQQSGYSRLGIGMRLKDAFNDPRFTVTAGGVRLSLQGSSNRSRIPEE